MSAIRRVTAPEAPEPPPETWSNCLVANGVAYVAGLVARVPPEEGPLDDCAQARIIFAKMKALIEAAGGDMADVVKVVIYVTDIRRRQDVWRARAEFFTGNFPVSTLIEVSKLADPEITVEIDAVAHIGASKG